jgi:putative heme transporter
LTKTRSKNRRRQLIIVGLGLAVVVGTFAFVLPRIADYGEVWDVVRDLSWSQLGVLVLATLLNLATYAPPWQAALPGLRFRQAFVLTQASTASTYIAPGGAAVGMALAFAMLRGWGFRTSTVTLAVALTGVWNQFVTLGFPLVALALLTLENQQNALLQTVALVGLALFVLAAAAFAVGLSSERLARRVGDLAARLASWAKRVIHRGPVSWTGESFARFRNGAVGLLRRRWHVLTLATLTGHLSVFLLLLVCLRVFGVSGGEVSVIEAFAAWSLIRLLGAIPITPGGLGVIEVGLTTALVGFGGDNAEVVAAVLVYRFLTIVPTLVLGLIAGATWKRHGPKPTDAVVLPLPSD